MPPTTSLLSTSLLGAASLPVPLWTIGLIVAAVGVALLMPHATRVSRALGAGLSAIGVGVLFASLPWQAPVLTQSLFYVLTAITLVGAVGAISSRAAIYCAIWFAGSLLGVAGLLVLAGAQFLGIATIVVYAGAIVVTFLFVIMLAQPRGNETYDRVSWGSLSKPMAVFAASALVAASIFSQEAAIRKSLREDVADAFAVIPASSDYPKIESSDVVAASYLSESGSSSLEVVLRPTVFRKIENPDAQKAALAKAFAVVADDRAMDGFDAAKTQVLWKQALQVNDTLREHHVEALGVNLFGNQLVAVQVAGVLLLVALVGAISILAHDAPASRQTEAAR